ncbi:BQ5605_C029g10694 [Microbotryum silenes-dioicae]|uniref:BQ5605_C029g10694 protein n=1 Tax=Microbotryum silenes-dioicae TaxID=796604 RepID=A0A2X0PDD1_9BASI|nr:BQ5605_C029g10694 [Microbotryum silenes-dioicae]
MLRPCGRTRERERKGPRAPAGEQGRRPKGAEKNYQLSLRFRLPSGLPPKYWIDKSRMETVSCPMLRNNALHNDSDEPVFKHVHVPLPPTDEPIHSSLLFEKALRYLNQDKPTYVIPTGDAPLWEPSDELVLPKLWPHLDPFGLVGFCVERNLKVSLDEQVNHLLNLYDSDFDATQSGSNRSSTARNRHGCCVRNDQKIKDTKRYKATTEAEKHTNRIMEELQSVGDKIQGTTAQMLDMRNEIRGNVNAFGILGRIKDKFLDQAGTSGGRFFFFFYILRTQNPGNCRGALQKIDILGRNTRFAPMSRF